MIPPRGPFMVSRKLAMRDEPDIELRCSWHDQKTRVFSAILGKHREVLSGETVLHPIGALISGCASLVKAVFHRLGPLRKTNAPILTKHLVFSIGIFFYSTFWTVC